MRLYLASILILMFLMPAGCVSRQEIVESGLIQVVTTNSRSLKLSKPAIWQEGADLVVTGTVRRQPSYNGMATGGVNVSVLGPDQTVLAHTQVSLHPWFIPVKGSRESTYTARLPWELDEGQTVQVLFDAG